MSLEKIKELRIKKGLDRAQLSRLSGVPYRTIDNYEDVNKKPPLQFENIKKIARALEVPVDEII